MVRRPKEKPIKDDKARVEEWYQKGISFCKKHWKRTGLSRCPNGEVFNIDEEAKDPMYKEAILFLQSDPLAMECREIDMFLLLTLLGYNKAKYKSLGIPYNEMTTILQAFNLGIGYSDTLIKAKEEFVQELLKANGIEI